MRQSIFVLILIGLLVIISGAEPVYSSQATTNGRITRPDVSMKRRFAEPQVRTVEGIVQDVTNDSIQVRGKYYSISGVLLIDPSGEHLKQSSLSSGKKVEIFFQNGNITSILIYDDMVE
jgi:hypothetical protein